ncbi:MAG: peptide methionine sulfoxide reductase MsrA [Bacteroidota bacterium]|nr:MAG: peptide methionine sulfoxide reductase MsrA [Bacteroidota bacterium]HNU42095.1 peptide-methionine (S)-S-oxide reductase MsrA [Cyclobacteriaceae bacterium]
MKAIALLLGVMLGLTVSAQTNSQNKMKELETATLGSGCFWCTEAFFLRVKGIESVVSGYSGGKVKNPTYREVTTGLTGHAEVVQIKFDPQVITYAEVLEIFWNTHDPTTLNKQGADEGTQYRSVVFYHTEAQKKTAEAYKIQLDKSGAFKNPIVTEITAFKEFYKAEDYHQNYYALNPNQGYCQYVIRPKVEKFNKQFASKLKK